MSSKLNSILSKDMYICGKSDFQTQDKKITKFRIVANWGEKCQEGKSDTY